MLSLVSRRSGARSRRCFSVSSRVRNVDLYQLKQNMKGETEKLPEWEQHQTLLTKLREGLALHQQAQADTSVGMSQQEAMMCVDSAFMTSLVHLESRIASLVGQGFYTIGPCGEELISAVGLALRPTDAMALHYRHLAAQFSRQLKNGRKPEEILLDRARGHVVSSLDPVTGGGHCCIGGGKYDFLVTSTLASQAPPAVGRALGASLASAIGVPSEFPADFVSFVTVGDGSVNHTHFLTAINFAEYANFRRFKCPVIFGISDNNISISLPGYGWLTKEFTKRVKFPVFNADGNDLLDIWAKMKEALAYSRKGSRPCMIIFNNLPRRFGHAATDRQFAYLTDEQIRAVAERSPVEHMCAQLVSLGVTTYPVLEKKYLELWEKTEKAFAAAAMEPKIDSRQTLLRRNSAPMMPDEKSIEIHNQKLIPLPSKEKTQAHPLRKHMTLVYDEILTKYRETVYIGEDVTHGGYYLVTDGLAKKYPTRVADFPPEETALVGAAMGYAQAGLLPILEIPYAKYLDCASDMFFEACIMNWLSNGKQPNGMIIRLQGFGKGVFGGNFHTHNSLYLPPGLDVVCYSNGPDYIRGLRYAITQAMAGRIVMSVDCTNLLNLRHLHTDGDKGLLKPFPDPDEILSWDKVITYGKEPGNDMLLVAYGNSTITSLRVQKILQEQHNIKVTVVDCPYLSDVPKGLLDELEGIPKVVFVDECKTGQNPFAGFIVKLKQQKKLPHSWGCVTAAPTYNPLGTSITFVNEGDVIAEVLKHY